MKVGLWLTARHAPGRSPEAHFAALLEQVALARSAGFGMVSSGQHYLSPRLQTMPLLARLAADAGEMEMATSVLLLPLHNPVAVAEDAATMQVLLDGRFVLGVGLGHDRAERVAFGITDADAVPRFEASLEIMRRVWSGDGRPVVGRDFSLPERSAPPVGRPPRVWIGGNSPAARRRAAASDAAWFPSGLSVDALVRDQSELDQLVHGAGGHVPCDRPVGLWLHVSETDAAARVVARQVGHLQTDQSDRPGTIIGSAERCLGALREYRDAAGCSHVLLRVEVPGMTQRDVMRRIELLGTVVLPALASDGTTLPARS